MSRTIRILALMIAAVPSPAATACAQLSVSDGGFTQHLSQYDHNGNGLLEAHERAAILATAEDEPLSSFPIVCEGASAGEPASAGGAAASVQEEQAGAPHQVVRQIRFQRDQLAQNEPPGEGEAAEPAGDDTALADQYQQEPPMTAPKPVQFRTAVQYRMALNEQQAQARPQLFTQAATFGPVVGRAKQYPRAHFTNAVHSHCGCSRVSIYLAGY